MKLLRPLLNLQPPGPSAGEEKLGDVQCESFFRNHSAAFRGNELEVHTLDFFNAVLDWGETEETE